MHAGPNEGEIYKTVPPSKSMNDFSNTVKSADVIAAMKEGIHAAWTQDFATLKQQIDKGKVTSGDVFGTREYLKNNYLRLTLSSP